MTEAESAAAPTVAEPKRRAGVSFPQLTLQDAVDAVVVAGQNGPKHSTDAFAAYLGHQTANSGAFRVKLASLRDWGLIARGERDRVSLSGLAEDLVLAAPDHYEARHLLLTAFESCRVFGMLYNDSAKNTALDLSRIRTTVVMRHGVASEQADKFVDVFARSVEFAGLGAIEENKLTMFPRADVIAGEVGQVDSPTAEPAMTVTPYGPPIFSTAGLTFNNAVPVALRQSWPIDGGEIEFVIRTPKALPPAIYALVAEIAVTAAKMEELLKPVLPVYQDIPPLEQVVREAAQDSIEN